MKLNKSAVTITLGDMAENHVGMEQIGNMVEVGQGFNLDDLHEIKIHFENIYCECELYDLTQDNNILPSAYVLIVRKGIQKILSLDNHFTYKNMFKELINLPVDKKAFMYGRIVNKHARWNLCFSDYSSEPDYINGKGRIVNWNYIPITNTIYNYIKDNVGEKGENLQGEANYYYDIKKTGIGYHGDSERRKVVGIRLGATLPIYYQWYINGERFGEKIEINLDGGDIYFMSEKAVGTDWKKKTIYTLRHATGCNKYTD